jgi:hypothetical protein
LTRKTLCQIFDGRKRKNPRLREEKSKAKSKGLKTILGVPCTHLIKSKSKGLKTILGAQARGGRASPHLERPKSWD